MTALSGRRLFGMLGILCLIFAVTSGQEKRAQSKPSKTRPVTLKKPSTESSCDGALEIVPSQPSTFVRKRRPAKTATPPTIAVPEKKTDSGAYDRF